MRRSIVVLLFLATACGDEAVALETGSSGVASAEATVRRRPLEREVRAAAAVTVRA